MRKKKNEEEVKEREYLPETESEDETEEEMETAENEENSTDSDVDDFTIDTQPFIKPTKRSKKAVPKQNPLEKTSKTIRKPKRNDSAIATAAIIESSGDLIKKGKLDATKEKEKDGKTSSAYSSSSKEGDGKRKVIFFDENNVDVNLHNEAPQNIKIKKIQLSHSLIVLCQMIEGVDMKGSFNNDFAAMTFQKRMKDGKAFEFSIPLALAPTLQNAAQIMIDANPQFFSGIKKFKE